MNSTASSPPPPPPLPFPSSSAETGSSAPLSPPPFAIPPAAGISAPRSASSPLLLRPPATPRARRGRGAAGGYFCPGPPMDAARDGSGIKTGRFVQLVTGAPAGVRCLSVASATDWLGDAVAGQRPRVRDWGLRMRKLLPGRARACQAWPAGRQPPFIGSERAGALLASWVAGCRSVPGLACLARHVATRDSLGRWSHRDRVGVTAIELGHWAIGIAG